MAARKATTPRHKAAPAKRATRPYTVSDKVMAANKINAQAARGPKDTSTSSMNATKHARYAETEVLLPGECPIAYQERIDLLTTSLRAESPLECYTARLAAISSWNHDRTEVANTHALHDQYHKAERKRKQEQERTVVALADKLAARPVETVQDLRATAAGCAYLIHQFDRLAQMLVDVDAFYETDWHWAVRLSGRRLCDIFSDQITEAWTLDYLGSIPYEDIPKIDMRRAHQILDPIRPDTINEDEYDRRLQEWIQVVPAREKAMVQLKNRVAGAISELRVRRETLLVDEAIAARIALGRTKSDESVEGGRRLRYQETQRKAFLKMVDVTVAIRQGRIDGVFGEPVQIDGFVDPATRAAEADTGPLGEPVAEAGPAAPPLDHEPAPEPVAAPVVEEPAAGPAEAPSEAESGGNSNVWNEPDSASLAGTQSDVNHEVMTEIGAAEQRIQEPVPAAPVGPPIAPAPTPPQPGGAGSLPVPPTGRMPMGPVLPPGHKLLFPRHPLTGAIDSRDVPPDRYVVRLPPHLLPQPPEPGATGSEPRDDVNPRDG